MSAPNGNTNVSMLNMYAHFKDKHVRLAYELAYIYTAHKIVRTLLPTVKAPIEW